MKTLQQIYNFFFNVGFLVAVRWKQCYTRVKRCVFCLVAEVWESAAVPEGWRLQSTVWGQFIHSEAEDSPGVDV